MNRITAEDTLLEQAAEVGAVEGELPVDARTLDKFVLDEVTIGKTLWGIRWLCAGGSLLVVGPTGVGKSSFSTQFAVMGALGRPFFGIKPTRKLKVVVFQAENDAGDIAEMRDGIFRGLGLTEAEQAEVCERIVVVCESVATGFAFVALVEKVVIEHKPDIVLIDPLFAFLGDSVTEQKAVSAFLRNGLNPILQKYSCGLVLIHHTNKPKSGKEKPDWQGSDFAYLGSGTAELANWARAVMAIRSIGSHSVFTVELGKRGRRAGLVNDEGQPLYSFAIKHAAHGIHWEPATEEDMPSQESKSRAAVKVADVVVAFGKKDASTYTHLVEALIEKHAVSDRTAKKAIARALGEGTIGKTASGLYERIERKGER